MSESTFSIQRINFIERAPFVLTYRKMVMVGGVLFGVVLLLGGLQAARTVWYNRQVLRLSAEVTRLEAERERVLRESAPAVGSDASANPALLEAFKNALPWSILLKELTAQRPLSLWLTSFKSSEKAEVPSHRVLLLNGQSEEAGAMTLFLKSMADSPYFENVILTSSKQEVVAGSPVYQFSADLSVKAPVAKGGL